MRSKKIITIEGWEETHLKFDPEENVEVFLVSTFKSNRRQVLINDFLFEKDFLLRFSARQQKIKNMISMIMYV